MFLLEFERVYFKLYAKYAIQYYLKIMICLQYWDFKSSYATHFKTPSDLYGESKTESLWPWNVSPICCVVHTYHSFDGVMMTSSNGNIFRVTGPRPVTRTFDVFFDLRLNKRLSKQPRGWWFETQSWSLWRHCNVTMRPGKHNRGPVMLVTIYGWLTRCSIVSYDGWDLGQHSSARYMYIHLRETLQ